MIAVTLIKLLALVGLLGALVGVTGLVLPRVLASLATAALTAIVDFGAAGPAH